jgi:hypothetical protein
MLLVLKDISCGPTGNISCQQAQAPLAESPVSGFEAVSLQNFCRGKTLLRLFPSPDSTRVGVSGTGSVL